MALRVLRISTPKRFNPSLPVNYGGTHRLNPNPNPNLLLHSNSSPIDASLSSNHLAHKLFDQFSKPPNLRNSEALRSLGRWLTPETVETVLKDLKAWRAAHEFFRWASWQVGFRHSCYTYNAMASILSHARQRAHLKDLAAEVVNGRCPMTPGALGFLIRCLGDQGLVDEANFVFEHAGDLYCAPNSYTYNCLLEVLAKAGQVEMVESRFREMVDGLGREPDKYTLTSVLQSYCNAGKLNDVLDIFNRINARGWVDAHVFTILVVSFCKWGKVDRACELIEQMEASGVMPNEKTFCVLIHGFTRQGRVDKGLEMFQKLKSLGCSGDLPIFSVLIEKLCEGKELGRALDLYLEMKSKDISPDARLLRMMIPSFCREGDLVTANRLLKENVEKLNSGSLVSLYNAVLDGLVSCGEVERAHRLVRAMMESQRSQASLMEVDEHESTDTEAANDTLFGIKRVVCPNVDSFNIVVCCLCKTEKLDIALNLVNDMIKIGCKGNLLIYNNLINELCNVDRLEESYELLQKMKELGFAPTEFTHNSIFHCLCKRGNLSAAVDFLREMRRQGHVPWIKNCTMVVQQLCKQGKVAEASGFLDDMVQVGFLPDMVAYSAAIHGLCQVGDVDKALKLFRDISLNCYVPDVVAHNILINGFCKAGRLTAAQEILNEMLAKGLVPSPVTYNLMIDGWCQANRIDDALACFSDMVEGARPPTVVTYTTLIDGLCNAGRAEHALELWNEVREKGCAPNRIMYMALVHGLCKCGREDAALVFFHEMKEKEFEPDTFVSLLLINSLILKGHTVKAFDLLKEVLLKHNFPTADSKTYRLLKKALYNLLEDACTSLDVKTLIEGGFIPTIQSVHDIMEETNK